MYYIGIDPGKRGAIAIIDDNSNAITVIDCPVFRDTKDIDILSIIDLLQAYNQSRCVIEKSQAMPGQGVVSMFNYGKGYGIYLGILECLDIKYNQVPPQTWKRRYNLSKDKQLSIDLAKKLFPECAKKLLKSKDGRAEALLLAQYCKDKYYG